MYHYDQELDIDKLRAVAQAADGSVASLKWTDSNFWRAVSRGEQPEMRGTPLEYLTTFNPALVLQLLDLAQREYERRRS